MKLLCLSASNISKTKRKKSTSYNICDIALQAMQLGGRSVNSSIIELKEYTIYPCTGCGKCYDSRRCIVSDSFNYLYEQVISSDMLLIVSPHYAPIPAKLAAFLEKMEQITFLHWFKDNKYQSEVFGIPTGIISHGGGGQSVLQSYKRMVNDTIANALDTIQLRLVPYNDEWNTGISLPVKMVITNDRSIFPVQEYDWDTLSVTITQYVSKILKTAEHGK